jgi:5-methylcytosine-specific restriction endonuclease McrA
MSIASLVQELIEAGTSPALAADVVAHAFALGCQSVSPAPSRKTKRQERNSRYYERRKQTALPPKEWKQMRHLIMERDGSVCGYCHGPAVPAEIDHIIPLSRGGTNDPRNLTVACRACNTAKNNRTPAEWEASHD